MHRRSVSIRAGRSFGMRKTMGATCMMAAMLGCVFAQPYDRPTLKRGAVSQRPDLEGLWVVLHPKDPNVVLAYFVIFQSGGKVSVNLMPPGKEPMLLFEGTLNGMTIEGKVVDITSSPENPQYVPKTATLLDANHVQLDEHTVLKRAGDAELTSFRQAFPASPQKLRNAPFLLDGTWRYEKGYPDIWVRVKDGDITMTNARPYQPVFFRGKYESNPVINGKKWGDGSTLENPVWIDSTVTIESPDRLRYGSSLFLRVSDPPQGDIPCESGNRYHIGDRMAWRRGAVAMKEQDNKTARCWLEIAGDYPQAQSSLSALLVTEGDYERAFDLATKSAKKGDITGEVQLSAMYREGKGTPVDAGKADYWLQKAQQSTSAAAWKKATGQNEFGINLLDVANTVMGAASMVDFGPNAVPPSCLSQRLGNRQTVDCQH